MHPEVSAAQMDADGHILRVVGDNVVVDFDVERQKCFAINTLLLHALEHLLGAEVSEERIIKLDVA